MNPYPCPYCHRRYRTRKGLDTHKGIAHTEEYQIEKVDRESKKRALLRLIT